MDNLCFAILRPPPRYPSFAILSPPDHPKRGTIIVRSVGALGCYEAKLVEKVSSDLKGYYNCTPLQDCEAEVI